MYCRGCQSEYVPGIDRCPDCDLPLVDELAPPAAVASEPVVVFSSTRTEPIAIAKSILLSSGISFGVHGEEVQDLFGYGRFPLGSNVAMGPVHIMVPAENARDALELLSSLGSSPVGAPVTLGEDDQARGGSRTWRLARAAGRVVAATILAAMSLELVFALVELLT